MAPPGKADTITKTPADYTGPWGIDFTLQGDFAHGNVETLNGSAKLDAFMKCDDTGYSLRGYFEGGYKSKDGTPFQQMLRGEARFDWRLMKFSDINSLWISGIGTAFHDRSLKIDARVTYGGGLRFLTETKPFISDLSLFPVGEYEDGDHIARLSLRELIRFKLADNLRLDLDALYVPSVMDIEDFRITGSASLNIAFLSWLSGGVKFSTNYDHQPKDDSIKKLDITTSAFLSFKFARGEEK